MAIKICPLFHFVYSVRDVIWMPDAKQQTVKETVQSRRQQDPEVRD